MTNNTIFDDVFRTIVEKMTYLIVPLINEVFHTSYPEDVKIMHLRNEHQLEDGELITDARLLIGDKVYHIECQSSDDTMMAIRMFEYDLAIALENRRRVGRKFYVEFPKSCVIYLRSTKNTPDVEEVKVLFPDGQVCVYRVPTVKMELYTKDSIFEKNLLMLLPFYVMRYENVADIFAKDSEKLQGLLMEYEDIRIKLEREFSITGRAGMYTDLNKLIIRISDYIFEKKKKSGKEWVKLWAERFCSWSRSDFGRKVWLLEKSVEKRKGKQKEKQREKQEYEPDQLSDLGWSRG